MVVMVTERHYGETAEVVIKDKAIRANITRWNERLQAGSGHKSEQVMRDSYDVLPPTVDPSNS